MWKVRAAFKIEVASLEARGAFKIVAASIEAKSLISSTIERTARLAAVRVNIYKFK